MTISTADLDNLETNIKGADDWVGGNSDKDGVAANGQTFKSITKVNAEAQVSFNNQLSNFGFEPPITFQSGINVNRNTLTVEESGDIFAPLVSAIPFTTTGVFNAAQWYIITDFIPAQATNKNKVLTTDGVTAAWSDAVVNITFPALTGFLSETTTPSINDIVEFKGFAVSGDGGGAQWKHNGVTGQTASQSPLQLNDALFNDGNGNQWEVVKGPIISLLVFGGITQAHATAALTGCLPRNIPIDFSPADIDIVVSVPTIATTLQIASDYSYLCRVSQGKFMDITIDSAHVPASGIIASNGDYGHLRISSVDAEVLTNNSFTGRFIVCSKANAPILNTIIDGQGFLERVYSLTTSLGRVEPGKGGRGCTGRVLYCNASNVSADASVWSDSDEIFCTNGAAVNLASAVINDMATAGAAFAEGATGSVSAATMTDCGIGLHAKDGSMVDGELLVTNGCTNEAVRVDNAVVTLDRAQLLTCQQEGINQISGSTNAPNIVMTGIDGTQTAVLVLAGECNVNGSNTSLTKFSKGLDISGAAGCKATDATITSGTTQGNGVLVQRTANCDVSDAIITGFTAGRDIRVLNGGIVSAIGTETSASSGSANFPDLVDTEANGNGGFNVILNGGRGILWS